MATAKREMTFLLAGPERRLLIALASRLPRVVVSDHLTAVGAIGALCTGIAYALSAHHSWWLWIASGMLVVNWLPGSGKPIVCVPIVVAKDRSTPYTTPM